MGSGASRGLAASISAVPPEELKAALAGFDADAKARLRTALARPVHCTMIMYDFLEESDHEAWLAHFVDAKDGFRETAESPGIRLCRLYVSVTSPTKVGFYEEWDCQESQTASTKRRAASGFMRRWFDLDLTTMPPTFKKLKAEGCVVEQGTLIKSSVGAGLGKGVDSDVEPTYCVTVTYDFKEQADCDAFLSHYSEAEDGLRRTAGADGCILCKLYRASTETTGWFPQSGWSSAKVGLYEEWWSKEARESLEAERVSSGFMARWFGLDAGAAPPRWAKLQGERAVVEAYTLVKSE